MVWSPELETLYGIPNGFFSRARSNTGRNEFTLKILNALCAKWENYYWRVENVNQLRISSHSSRQQCAMVARSGALLFLR